MIGNRQYKYLVTLLIVSVLFVTSTFVSLGEVSDLVTIEVDDDSIQMGTSVVLTLTMDTSIEAEEIGVEGLENFDIDSTSQSSSSTNINGVKSSTYQYKLTLSPKSVGEFNLKAVVNDGSKVYESNTIKMIVSQRDTSLDSESEDVFIKTIISKDNYFFGESIVISYELYSRYNLNDFGFLDTVTYDGFIIESVPKEDLGSSIIEINGDKYLKQIVKKDILVPTSSGSFEIPSYRFQANLSTGDFFSRSEPRYLDTQSVEFNVQELPLVNAPQDFSGLVGTLDVKYSLDKNEVPYGEAVTLNVLLSGTVGLEGIGSLYEGNQKGFTIYETEKFTEKTLIDLDYIQSKEYELIIVPDETGDLILDPVKLWYFDTDMNDYNMVEIPQQLIKVTGLVKTNENNSSSTKSETILISQVNYEDIDDGVLTIQVSKKVLINILIVIIIIVFLIVVYRVIKSRPVDRKKHVIKSIRKAQTIEALEGILDQYILEQTNLNRKAYHRKAIISCFNNSEEKQLIEAIIIELDKNKINKSPDMKLIKDKSVRLIEITKIDGDKGL